MNRLLKNAVASALVASVGITCVAQADEISLLVVGPVDAVLPKQQAAVILGQKISLKSPEQLTVGETAAVFGKISANGVVVASEVRHQGPYVAGATTVLLTGVVQKSETSIGQAQVGGLTVDLTPAMASGPVSAAVGSTIQIVGTQPGSGGLVLASGISGSGLNGISGSGLNGISGSGRAVTSGISGSGLVASGISGSGLNGISGSGLNGISGSGRAVTSGISGSGRAVTSGISGSGLVASGISGSGLNGISGSGLNGISGSGRAVTSGISGSGLAASGISGSGLNGISGSGLNGISGSGLAASGISGSGLNGISGSGLNGINGGGL